MVVGDFAVEVDVLVIGSGPGGYVAAIRAAQLGHSVTIVEKGSIGGVCLNEGCIPSKALITAAQTFELMHHAKNMGIQAQSVQIDMREVQKWKQHIVDQLSGGVQALLKGNKIQIIRGEAYFLDRETASVSNEESGKRLQFRHCILATGSTAVELDGVPYGGRILSSTEALALTSIPKSLIVIGGGYIGIELGQTFAKWGTQVTILEASERILPGFEPELTRIVQRNLEQSNVVIIPRARVQQAQSTENEVQVTYSMNGEEQQITAEYVLVTVGRRPNSRNIGLENLNMEMNERGQLVVDKQCRTNIPNIYAIGDLVPGPALAHKASYEGKIAAEAIAGHSSEVDYRVIPEIVFSDPEIASVGWSETAARQQGYDVITNTFPYAANGRALTMNAANGFVKIVAERSQGWILGAQIVGPEASNLIAECALAIEMGATLEDIALTIHAHPTLAEMVMESCEGALGQGIHQLKH